MAGNIFRIFNPEGQKEDPVEKRRAQLRQAQKTYRDRKDKYARSLEREISKIRQNEANLLREIERLQGIVKTLSGALDQRGADGSDDTTHWMAGQDQSPSLIGKRTASSPLRREQSQRQRQSEQLQMLEHLAGRSAEARATPQPVSTAQVGVGHEEPWLHPVTKASPNEHVASFNPRQEAPGVGSDLHRPGVRICDVDLSEAGMDFVLTLERPCLGHLHENPDKPHEPTGHALTVTAQLLPCVPRSPDEPHALAGMLRQQLPAAMLDTLLNLSSELCSGEEVTPIQAWNYIRCQPQFGGLEVRSLCQLAEMLRDAVKCHGFGAVVERSMFEALVVEMLLIGRPF